MKKEFEKLGYKANVLPRDRWYDQSRAGYVIVLRGKILITDRWEITGNISCGIFHIRMM